MEQPPVPRYAAVGTSLPVTVTSSVKPRDFKSEKLEGPVTMVHAHAAAAFQPHGGDLALPPNSKVPVDVYTSFKSVAAPYGHVPTAMSGVVQGPPHQPYILTTVHGAGNGEQKDFVGVKAVDVAHADDIHVLPHTLLLEGSHGSVFYSDETGKLNLHDVRIDQASLPDHSEQAMAIAAGNAAITSDTDSKGRVATLPDSAVVHFGAALGYTLEPISKPKEDGSTHVLKKPSKDSLLPMPTPTAIVEAALAKLKETSPPNVGLVTTQTNGITAKLSVTMSPRDAGDKVPVVVSNQALHTGIQPDNFVSKRVFVGTHERHDLRRLTGAIKDDSDSDDDDDKDGSSSSSDDDDRRNTGKTPKDDSDDDDMPQRHKSGKKHKGHH